MTDDRQAQSRNRSAALQRDVARQDARGALADTLAELDAAGTHYRLHYAHEVDRPDWQGGPDQAGFSHLDWSAVVPTLEMATESWPDARALVRDELARRAEPADIVLVTQAGEGVPQLAIARADFDAHADAILGDTPGTMLLCAPSARWLIALCPPWLRIMG